ncbi:MAG TPA: Hsp20/alpha crystallin family protein [Nitrososphaerales archaeon]|nr:Hsp20/alpha crystallin family protein [Nitrososphaerales archaeon]HUK75676.1 Hsp20/alpha crystallin family protein [Nitrososphaerales archaeon]
MWEDEEVWPLEAFTGARGLRTLAEQFLGQPRSPFDVKTKSIRPLFRVESTERSVTVTFDLPYVEKKDITLTSTGSTVDVEAKMRKPVTLRVGGTVQRRVLFERYTTSVTLPRSVDVARGKATFKNGLLRVRFPVSKKGNKLKIS